MTLPDIVVQEIRNTLAVHCREICMSNKADGEKTDKQMQLLYKCFHGTESHASVLDLFLTGRGLYAAAFDKVDLENNRAGNEDRAKAGFGCMLMLRDLLHCDPSEFFDLFVVSSLAFVCCYYRLLCFFLQVPIMPSMMPALTGRLLLRINKKA